MSDLKCPICGDPTNSYMGNYRKDGLCKKHAFELKSGKLLKCEKCGEFHYANQPCKCDNQSQSQKQSKIDKKQEGGKCIVCGENAPNGLLCRKCYYEMLDYKDSFDKNAKIFDLKDYYFNLRSNIYRMKNFDYIQSNCNKLMALATLTKDLFGEESLTDRVANDIKDIVEKKKPQVSSATKNASEYSKSQDSHKEELCRTADGHYVKSNPESIIDDILYDLRIVHCYEKKVPINADEQTITSDWFIPVLDGRHGIYVEYWGMNTAEYLENKQRKRKAYKDHDIPLIEIEKDDYNDRHGLSDRLVSEINALAERYFRIKDYIK